MLTSAELRAAGLGPDAVARRVAQGRLVRQFRGVYIVGPVVPPLAVEAAALLACGDDAALSHASSLFVCGLIDRAPPVVEVTVPRQRRQRDGLRVHHAELGRDDTRTREGLRVTSPQRTLLDMAPRLSPRDLERLVAEAQVKRLIPLGAIQPRPHTPGAPALRAATAEQRGLTRSEAERALRRLAKQAGLEQPETNVRIARHEVDALWREQRLVVEVDGFRYHRGSAVFERDRRKTQDLQAAGYRVIRITARQLKEEPLRVTALIAAALAQ